MNWRIRMKKRHALFVLVATCSAISYLFGFIAHAETVRGEEGLHFLNLFFVHQDFQNLASSLGNRRATATASGTLKFMPA